MVSLAQMTTWLSGERVYVSLTGPEFEELVQQWCNFFRDRESLEQWLCKTSDEHCEPRSYRSTLHNGDMRVVLFKFISELEAKGDLYYMWRAIENAETATVAAPGSGSTTLSEVLDAYLNWAAIPTDLAVLVKQHIKMLREEEARSVVSPLEGIIRREAVIETVCALFPAQGKLNQYLRCCDEFPNFLQSVSMASNYRDQIGQYWDMLLSNTSVAVQFLIMLSKKVPNHKIVRKNLSPEIMQQVQQYL